MLNMDDFRKKEEDYIKVGDDKFFLANKYPKADYFEIAGMFAELQAESMDEKPSAEEVFKISEKILKKLMTMSKQNDPVKVQEFITGLSVDEFTHVFQYACTYYRECTTAQGKKKAD